MEALLTPMSRQDYARFLRVAVPDYARDKVENGTWAAEDALSKAEAAFQSLLPRQHRTPNHSLRNVEVNREKIGFVWYAVGQQEGVAYGFLYQIRIEPPFRNRGYGSQAVKLFIQAMDRLGIESVGLHVFGHNTGALRLYERLGFRISDYTLKLKR